MAILWSSDLETGIREVDSQHKELFDRVNKVLEACNQGKGKETVGETLNFLGEYVVKHFRDEQRLHQINQFPDREAHKKAHDEFIKTFDELKEKFDKDGASLSVTFSLNKTLVNWLVQHIKGEDKRFAAYLKDKK